MPKTTQRQAFVWSSSSDDDDDDVSLPYARKEKSPRPRHYGKRRPIKASGRTSRFDSSKSKASSSLPTKQRRAESSTRNSANTVNKKRSVIDEDISSNDAEEEISFRNDKKASSSRALSSKKSRFSSRAPTASKNDRRHSLEQSAPSYPAFTPILSRKKRSSTRIRTPIRVNLTPDPRDDMPKGWLSKSQLLDVARRHKGMAIQYRVMYHTSQKPIRDHNAGTSRKIRYRDPVVQSRFACVSGSHGGSTYSFMRWKLPGTLLQARNAKHVTIYKDTRPRLDSSSRGETDYPLIVLCGELKDADRRMAERFLRHAQAGMTPQDFFSNGNNSDDDASATKESEPMQVEKDDSPLVSQDEDGDEPVGYGGYDSEMENEAPSPKQRESHSPSKARPLGDQNSILKPSSNSSKRGRDSGNEGKTSKRAKKKVYGGARNKNQTKQVMFQIGDDNESSSPQFLALVEGAVSVDDKAEDYIRDVFMNGRAEKLPSTGRMLELPGEALPGTWSGELVDMKRGEATPGKGMMRDKLENLKDFRILLRHDSTKFMGPLKLSQSSSVSSPLSSSSSNMEHRIRGGGAGSLRTKATGIGSTTVSLIDPSHSRRHDFLSQGIVSNESLLERSAFVGSISLVGFDGFSSFTDAQKSGSIKSSGILEACRKKAIETNSTSNSLENILPIPSAATTSEGKNVGVSFLCKLQIEDSSYGLMVAHDEDGRIVAADVVFDESLFESRSSSSSTSSYQYEPNKLTEHALQRHSALSQQPKEILPASQNPVDASSDYTDDDAGILMLDDDEPEKEPQPDMSSPSASVPEVIKAVEDSYHTKPKSVVTIDPTPSTKHVAHVPSGVAAPKSILKKRSSLIGKVTPAPQSQEAEKQIESLSSSDDTIECPTTSRFFVTPTPGRKKENREESDGFLSLLDQVAEGDSDSADARNANERIEQEEQDDDDDDDDTVFEDATSEGFDLYESETTESPESSATSCQVSKLPFHHGSVECEAWTTDTPVHTIEAVHARRSYFRGLPFSAIRLLILGLLLWQTFLVPNGSDIQRPSLPRRPQSSVSTPIPFVTALHFEGAVATVKQEKSWFNQRLW